MTRAGRSLSWVGLVSWGSLCVSLWTVCAIPLAQRADSHNLSGLHPVPDLTVEARVRPIRWLALCCAGVGGIFVLVVLAQLLVGERVIRWSGIGRGTWTPERLAVFRWYAVHPLGVIGAIVACIAGWKTNHVINSKVEPM